MDDGVACNSNSSAPHTFAEAAQRLEHIVDDTPPRDQCRAWVKEQFLAGRDADSLLADLLANG